MEILSVPFFRDQGMLKKLKVQYRKGDQHVTVAPVTKSAATDWSAVIFSQINTTMDRIHRSADGGFACLPGCQG